MAFSLLSPTTTSSPPTQQSCVILQTQPPSPPRFDQIDRWKDIDQYRIRTVRQGPEERPIRVEDDADVVRDSNSALRKRARTPNYPPPPTPRPRRSK
ncbi:hypothetical protein PtA15_9A148 [Puccinia triticina]|uniref:Uncharacterized protein n=1 Tax=Puccinia triticina TaxID=208348 RepID=A0ABY7CSX7_9BASI|nr:uncharacterized protein PtA15_9A148 [Puccinia triticina]WAQ88023.1 hypothetical protein PtA15_9A148 [Puccinia triticina]